MKWNNINVGLFCSLSLFIGIVGTIYFKKWTEFTIESNISFEINPLEPLVLLITLLLGYYVARIVAKQNDTEATRKNITINRFNSFDHLLTREIHKVLALESIELTSVAMKCKALRSRINSLTNVAVTNGYFKSDDSDIYKVNSSIRDLWEIMTDSSKEGVHVENNIVTYTENVKQEVDSKLIQIQEDLLNLMFRLK